MAAPALYPLKFDPIFRQYLWGGRKLADLLGKSIGEGDDFAESWEIVDHQNDQSVVTAGPLAGRSLSQLISEFGSRLIGASGLEQINSARWPEQLRGRFPLLLKFLDANRVLSVQVHPDDSYGQTMSPPDLGKTEAWFVLHAEPDSVIYAGLNAGVTRDQLAEAIRAGETEKLLHVIRPQAGDCIFIPAGTVHAIGEGLVIAEIQQASDTTFRLFDWNRVDKQGQSRPLHVDQSLEVIDFQRGPVHPQRPKPIECDWGQCNLLVDSDKFVLKQHQANGPFQLPQDDRFRIIIGLDQPLVIQSDVDSSGHRETALGKAESLLVPATVTASVSPAGETAGFLEIHLP